MTIVCTPSTPVDLDGPDGPDGPDGLDADPAADPGPGAAGWPGGVGLPETVEVVVGVDTHEHFHVAAAVDATSGGVIATVTVEASDTGYEELVEFADQVSGLRAWAIEGTSSHGAGLTRHLVRAGELVCEVDRPQRAKRRRGEKSDPIDAIRAGREALSRPRLAAPKAGGVRQAIAVIMVARRTAVQHATDAERQLRNLILNGPQQLRARFTGMTLPQMVTTAARLRDPQGTKTLTATAASLATALTGQTTGHSTGHSTGQGAGTSVAEQIELAYTIGVVRDLAKRAQGLRAEALAHEKQITKLVRCWRPDLLEQLGVGPIVAAVVLCAWSHPGRIHSEAAFAMLAGTAPLLAASGVIQDRHRLNWGGNRQLNRALHTIVLTRQRCDEATRVYTERLTSQGKNPREIRRCLKRYITRQLFRILENPPT